MNKSQIEVTNKWKLEFVDITKTFLSGKIIANNKINLKIANNEVHSIVGENGSGKSTLMSILFGLYKQEEGIIKIDEEIVDMYRSGAAKKYKIGMVHQHFHLIEDFTVLQNIILGQEKLPITEEETAELEEKISLLRSKIVNLLNENPKLQKINEQYLILREQRNQLQETIKVIRDDSKYRKLKLQIEKINNKINKLKINEEKNSTKISSCEKSVENKTSLLNEIKEQNNYFNLTADEKEIIEKIDKLKRSVKLKELIRIEKEKVFLEKNLATRNAVNKVGFINSKKHLERFYAISNYYNIQLSPYEKAKKLSVGDRQKIEILKVLWQDKDIIVFDEPTATLSVSEIELLIELVKKLKENNKTIIFISHKLEEVKKVSDNISILNRGKLVGTFKNTKAISIKKISELMIGKTIDLKFEKTKPTKKVILDVKNLSYVTHRGFRAVDDVNFQIYENEIFGLAGIEGNGQEEIFNLIAGLKKPVVGSKVMYYPEESESESEFENIEPLDLLTMNIKQRLNFVSHVPINRFKHGIVSNDSIFFNSFITSFRDDKFYRLHLKKWDRHFLIDNNEIQSVTNEIINKLNVEGAGELDTPIKDLSGGNQQKFVIGRELLRNHRLFLAGHPTRGLDVNAIKNIYNLMIENSENKATLIYSLELSELIAVCNRIAILYKGRIVDIIDPDKYKFNTISNMLVGKK